ncbi:MAG: hypothetical protein JO219_06090 [Candidatus Eremiobacteraeota bacterium]|nr:hypothetical protein [Candidatus Eremiobacteraeota bacterium]MBV8365536.1 hypothetical protein [Candidatus Eremiobacteraeota bacterium]
MRYRTIAGPLLCVVAATTLAPAIARAATLVKPPIAIISCRAENFGQEYGGAVADVLIIYKNTYSANATNVRFSLNYQGTHAFVVDKGAFAPNAVITHRFHTFTGQNYLGKTLNACVAVHAAFADGSTWSFQ